MNKICGIYKITSPSNKIYIGQSTNCAKRKLVYRRIGCKDQTKIYHSIKKHGWDKHEFEIIHQCDPLELNGLEKYYVDLYQTFNSEFGLNLKDGGGDKAPNEKGQKQIEENKAVTHNINRLHTSILLMADAGKNSNRKWNYQKFNYKI